MNISEVAQRYLLHPPVKPLIDLPRMGDLALKMLHEALDAFLSGDASLAKSVLRQDDWLDALKDQVFREVLAHMLGDPQTIEPGVDLILMSRHLERVGDHATSIAEDVIFIVEARDVRHRSARPAVSTNQDGGRTVERRKGAPRPARVSAASPPRPAISCARMNGCRSRSTARKNNASPLLLSVMARSTRLGRPRRWPPPLFLH